MSPGRRLSDRAWSQLAAITLAVASILLVGGYLHGAPALSPIDELQHFDYVVKAPHIPRAGELLGEEAMRAQACRGIDYPGFVSPACDTAVLSPGSFQEYGQSTAYIHPPTYYFITAAMAHPVSAVLGISLYAAARLVGAVWLFAGLWVTWCCGRRLGAPPAGLLGILLLIASAPYVWISTGNIGPDAAALLVGGGTLWLALRWPSGARQGLALAAAGVLSVAFKMNHIVAIAPVCTYVIAMAVADRESGASTVRRWWTGIRRAAVPAVLAAVSVLLVNRVVELRRLPGIDQVGTSFRVDSLSAADIAQGWNAFLPPNARMPFLTPILAGHPLMVLANTLLAAVLVLSCLHIVLSASFARSARLLAGSVAAWMVLGGPVYTIANFVMTGQKFPEIPPRYGLSLLAALAVVAALALRPIRLQRAVLGAGVGYVGYTVLISFVDIRVF